MNRVHHPRWLGALAAGSIAGALAYLESLDTTLFNPFNLLVGDPSRLLVATSWEAPRLHFSELAPGLHVLANDRLGSPLYPKTQRAHALASPLLHGPWSALRPALVGVLGDHHRPPPADDAPCCDEELRPVAAELQALCVHTDRGYETCSSTLLAMTSGGLAHYDFVDGAPCSFPSHPVFP